MIQKPCKRQIYPPAEGCSYGSTCTAYRCIVLIAAFLRFLQTQKIAVAHTKPATNDPATVPAIAPGGRGPPELLGDSEELGPGSGEPEPEGRATEVDVGCGVATPMMLM